MLGAGIFPFTFYSSSIKGFEETVKALQAMPDLHSTLVLLKANRNGSTYHWFAVFTFYSSSIKGI